MPPRNLGLLNSFAVGSINSSGWTHPRRSQTRGSEKSLAALRGASKRQLCRLGWRRPQKPAARVWVSPGVTLVFHRLVG